MTLKQNCQQSCEIIKSRSFTWTQSRSKTFVLEKKLKRNQWEYHWYKNYLRITARCIIYDFTLIKQRWIKDVEND